MTTTEIVDRLCSVTEAQSKLIRELFTFINEQAAVDAEIKKHFEEKCRTIDEENDLIEIGLRPYVIGKNQGVDLFD